MDSLFPNRVRHLHQSFILIAFGLAALGGPPLVNQLWPAFLEPVELWTIDTRFRIRPPIPVSQNPTDTRSPWLVEIDYDDEGVHRYGLGRWPWDRRIHAQVLKWLHSAEARTIIIDLLFEFPSRDLEEDQALADAIHQAANVILPVIVSENDQAVTHPAPTPALDGPIFPTPNLYGQGSIPRITDLTAPMPLVRETAASLGHVFPATDIDGSLRRIPLFYRAHNGFIPDISLAAAFHYLEADPSTLRIDLGHSIRFTSPRIGEVVIPIDHEGRAWINYAGAWGTRFPHFPYSILREKSQADNFGTLMRNTFKDRTVVLANLTTGLTDRGATPLDDDFLLGEVPLHMLNMILTQQFLRSATSHEALWSHTAPVVILTVTAMLAPPLGLVMMGLFLLCGYLLTMQYVFNTAGLILPAVNPIFSIIGGLILLLAARVFLVDRERRRFQSVLGSCLPPQTLRIIRETPNRIPELLVGHRRELTVLFADIKGFSTFCQQANPGEIQTLLKEYLEEMTKVIRGFGGTLDKYMGDGIMAFFGDAEPEDGDQRAEEYRVETQAGNAVQAGIAMQKKMQELNQHWHREGRESHTIRIGINTGLVTVGNLGTDVLWDYTVIGSEVNKAQRLESAADPGGLLLSHRTYDLASKQGILPQNLPPKEVALKGLGVQQNLYAIAPDRIGDLSKNLPPTRK